MQVAIIGAGLAGLSAAKQCQAQGHQVTIYERSQELGGRMGTRQTELGGFDYGAQYFTARSDRFKKEVSNWRKCAWIAPWESRLVMLDRGASRPAAREAQRYVPVPGMSALCKQLAHGLDVRLGQQVLALEEHAGQWLLSIKSDEVPIPASAGPFDAVLIAIPPEQASVLLKDKSALATQVQAQHLQACWTLMLGFQHSLNLDFDGAWLEQSRLGWIARDTSKPGHRAGERWVCHATPEWSAEHLEDDHERVKEKLMKAFHEATGSPIQAIHADTHRWRFAQAHQVIDDSHLWDAQKKIGVCGDWFAAGLEGGGRVENAFLSGLAAAQAVSLA